MTLWLFILVLDKVLLNVVVQNLHPSVELLLLFALDLVVNLVLEVFPVSSPEDGLQLQTSLTDLVTRYGLDQHMDSQLSPDSLFFCR